MDEKQLIARAQSGDFAAFTELINTHKGRVFGLVRRLIGNEQDAEDLVQETFLKAIDNIDRFRGEAAFGTWLHTIALNQVRAHAAKEKVRDLRPLEDYLPIADADDGHQHAAAHLSTWRDPHAELEADELRQRLNAAINELPYAYREAFVLRYFDELSVKEIAAITDESEAATKSRILRARLALREKLARLFEDVDGKALSGLHSTTE